MQNPFVAANAALRECNEGLAELLAEFDADRKSRRKSCPPPAVKDAALTVTAPAVSVQGAGSYFLRLNGNESAISLSRLRSSSVNGRLGLRTSRTTHASASTVRPAPTDIPSSVAPIPLPLWSL